MAERKSIFVALAACCWGISGGIGAILMNRGWDASVLAFYRGAIGFLFVLGWLIVRPHKRGWTDRRLWLWSAVAGLGIAGNFTFYFISISEGSVAVAATLMYCAPVFVYLGSFALKIEKFSGLKAVAIGIIIGGVILLTRFYKIDLGTVTPLAAVAGLLSGLSYAVFIFGFKYASSHGSSQSVLVIAFGTFITGLLWLIDQDRMLEILKTPDLPLLATLGTLGGGLSFILYFKGLKGTAPTTASIVAMVEPVTASLFGLFILNENLSGLQFLGITLILITVTGLSMSSSGIKSPSPSTVQ